MVSQLLIYQRVRFCASLLWLDLGYDERKRARWDKEVEGLFEVEQPADKTQEAIDALSSPLYSLKAVGA
jgi:hypothetical protein